jgi:PKD repeat protein
VLFEVVLRQPPPPGWNLQYRFDFGDGTQTDWISERQATHTYLSARRGSYPVHVEIASTYRDRVMPPKKIDSNVEVVAPLRPTPTNTATSVPITPSPTSETPSSPIATALPTATPPISPRPEVYLSVDKNPTFVGDSVIFSISTNLLDTNEHWYEVDFGDKSKPFRTNSNTVQHTFKTAGNYTASITVLGHGSQAHKELGILVRQRTTPPWLWVYILVGLVVLGLAYLVYAKRQAEVAMAARPTFYAHSDWDAPHKPPENVAINYGLYFHSNISAGQDRLETDGASSILRNKKQ